MEKLFKKYFPSTLTLSIALSITSIFLALLFTNKSSLEILSYYQKGLLSLLEFSMQMCLILFLGIIIGETKIINSTLIRITENLCTQRRALVVTFLLSSVASLLNWGLGLVIGALLVLKISDKYKNYDISLMCLSAYSGFLVWHGGFSGSIPLSLAQESQVNQNLINQSSIDFSLYFLSTHNLVLIFTTLLTCTLFFIYQTKNNNIKGEKNFNHTQNSARNFQKRENEKIEGIEKLENNKWPVFFFSLFIILPTLFNLENFSLNLNTVIIILLFLSYFTHESISSYIQASESAVQKVVGIIIQFPL